MEEDYPFGYIVIVYNISLQSTLSLYHLKFYAIVREICGFFFLWLSTSCSQVVIRKSSNDNFPNSKMTFQ